MGQNKEQLYKLLHFINELTKDENNAWFAAELRKKYGIDSNIQNFDAFVRLQRQRCKNKARQYYSEIIDDNLKKQLIDDHAMMLWYKSIRELKFFFTYVNYQIENMLNFYLDNTDCHNLILSNPLNYSKELTNGNFKINVNCQDYFFDNDKKPKAIDRINSLYAKIVFWAVDTNHMDFVNKQVGNIAAIVNIRNEVDHAYYGRTSNSSRYWYNQEDDVSLAIIDGIIRVVRNSIVGKNC